jgi:acetyltransferase-like isoleucine patch superfamily enzyme
MALIEPRPPGYAFERKPVKLPPRRPNSIQVIMFGLRRRLLDGPLGRFIRHAVERHPYIVGEHSSDCKVHPTAHLGNAILNSTSGVITIEEYAFLSHGVSLLAGTHDSKKTGLDRQRAIPASGHDITIGKGAWIATGVTIIGPCRIGENAVVAAGSVVLRDVPRNTLVGGIPARIIKVLDLPVVHANADC